MESHIYTSCKGKRYVYYSRLKESLKSVGNYTKSMSLPSKPTAYSIFGDSGFRGKQLICFDQLFQTTCSRLVPKSKNKILILLESIVLKLPKAVPLDDHFPYRKAR